MKMGLLAKNWRCWDYFEMSSQCPASSPRRLVRLGVWSGRDDNVEATVPGTSRRWSGPTFLPALPEVAPAVDVEPVRENSG